jgi:hypothetical protein
MTTAMKGQSHSRRPINAQGLDRLFKDAPDLLVALKKVMDADFLPKWLETPNRAFGGDKPSTLLARHDFDPLRRMVDLIESGQPT